MYTFIRFYKKTSLDFFHSKAIRLVIGAFLVSLFFIESQAQEVLRGLSVNPALFKVGKEKKTTQLKAAINTDSLELPFTDDFSTTKIYPDQNLWVNKQAYVNTTYPINSPTIGVATLDALDENGHLYKSVSSSGFSADTLTSRPFRLSVADTMKDDFYFSFFYQPHGLGDRPETGDDLILEFYNPKSLSWKKVWPDVSSPYKSSPTDPVPPFRQVIFPVAPEYKKNGFQFRFRNLASIDASDIAGKHSNVDHWNIDYIRLDTGRNVHDTIISDIAFALPITSLLKTYQSMPWNQYLIALATEIKPTIDISYKNLSTQPALIERYLQITEIKNGTIGKIVKPSLEQSPINAGSTVLVRSNFDGFEASSSYNNPLLLFDVKSYISHWKEDVRRENDTIHYNQIFSNYFAYDDSSSEAGYGIVGEGAQNASVAYSFESYLPDTLTGVMFYFNPTEHDTTLTYSFNLTVWADNNGVPGKQIYSQFRRPQRLNLNQFNTFKLDSGILVDGKFYVGFVQTEDNFLNIGFDLNNNNQRFLFFNTNGQWINSTKAGSLMIRPVMGSNVHDGPVIINPIVPAQSFGIYPNPADNQVYINTGDYKTSKPLLAEVYNVTGKLVLSSKLNENILDVSSLSNGLYLLKLSGENANFKPVKLLIQH